MKNTAILESFAYIRPWQYEMPKIAKSFMLDSGAFTFLNKKEKKDFNSYIDKYADFINAHKIDLFFELDVDSIEGYKQVLKYRHLLEAKTGKQVIPAWHLSRGKQNFIDMCKEYKYVSIGGIVTKEIKPSLPFFHFLTDIAHTYGAKIHALGFTPRNIDDYRFDSSDSTSWGNGNRFGYVYRSDLSAIKARDSNRLIESRSSAGHNFKMWRDWAITRRTLIHIAGTSSKEFAIKNNTIWKEI